MIDLVRPAVRAMAAYVPGEQPRDGAFVKLNTNECPYPPSPHVFEALRAALTGDVLRRYPDPLGTHFRQVAGRVLDLDPDGIMPGNGSDDVLTILTRTFVPEGGRVVSPSPSYLLYQTLASIQGAKFETVPFRPDGSLPDPWPGAGADLTFLANPNSPTGGVVPAEQLAHFPGMVDGPLVIDEAYADFAEHDALPLARKGIRNVVVTRSFSKSYALAGIRLGFVAATPDVVRQLAKVKDSYNCDALSLVAGAAALEDHDYFRGLRAKVLATRRRMQSDLAGLGFMVTPSQANFVWCRRGDRPVKPIYEELKRRRVLVRYMNYPGHGDGLRISVGTDAEIDRLFDELKSIL